MLEKLLFFTLLVSSLNLGSAAQRACKTLNQKALILSTLNGKVKGFCNNPVFYLGNGAKSDTNQVLTWLSVPYAEAPVRNLRFKSPSPVRMWSNLRDGTVPPKQCMQAPSSSQKSSSEDCLYLNIYAPYNSYVNTVVDKKSTDLLPIYVWIHGGAFSLGSSTEYDGTALASLNNMIVITINYRLGIFGFFYLNGTEARGNQALLDQNLALKWIYDNAATFGGDKNKITIGGESAGSWSVGYQMLFKKSWPYFRNAILQSGNPTTLDIDTLLLRPTDANGVSAKIGAKVGCNQKANADLLACLQTADKTKVNTAAVYLISYPAFVLDPEVFDQLPKDIFNQGKFKKCNVLTGYNTYEEASLAADEIGSYIKALKAGQMSALKSALKKRLYINDTTADLIINFYVPNDEQNNSDVDYYNYFIDIITDFQYKCPTAQLSEIISRNQKNAYTYTYGHKASYDDSNFDGAAHGDELEFVFGAPLFDTKTYTQAERAFSEKLVRYWGNFVKNEKPTANDEWLKFGTSDSSTIRNVLFLKAGGIKNYQYSTTDRICQFWNN